MYRIATNLTPEQREAREAHKAARRAKVRAAAAEKAAALGCKVCRRCKGDGSRESWAAMGSVCARCKGRGYELTAEMKRAERIEKVRAHLAEVEEIGHELVANIEERKVRGRRPFKDDVRRLKARRAQWVALRDELAALEAC